MHGWKKESGQASMWPDTCAVGNQGCYNLTWVIFSCWPWDSEGPQWKKRWGVVRNLAAHCRRNGARSGVVRSWTLSRREIQLACPYWGRRMAWWSQNRLDLERGRPVNTGNFWSLFPRVYSFSSGPQTGLRPRMTTYSVCWLFPSGRRSSLLLCSLVSWTPRTGCLLQARSLASGCVFCADRRILQAKRELPAGERRQGTILAKLRSPADCLLSSPLQAPALTHL